MDRQTLPNILSPSFANYSTEGLSKYTPSMWILWLGAQSSSPPGNDHVQSSGDPPAQTSFLQPTSCFGWHFCNFWPLGCLVTSGFIVWEVPPNRRTWRSKSVCNEAGQLLEQLHCVAQIAAFPYETQYVTDCTCVTVTTPYTSIYSFNYLICCTLSDLIQSCRMMAFSSHKIVCNQCKDHCYILSGGLVPN